MNIETGKKILELRRKLKMTQEQLANEVGVSVAAVSKWETGNSIPDVLMLCCLADYFNVSTDELLGRVKFTQTAIIYSSSKSIVSEIKDVLYKYGIKVIDTCDSMGTLNEILTVKHPNFVLVAINDENITEKERHDIDDVIKEKYQDINVVISDSTNLTEIVDGFECYFSYIKR